MLNSGSSIKSVIWGFTLSSSIWFIVSPIFPIRFRRSYLAIPPVMLVLSICLVVYLGCYFVRWAPSWSSWYVSVPVSFRSTGFVLHFPCFDRQCVFQGFPLSFFRSLLHFLLHCCHQRLFELEVPSLTVVPQVPILVRVLVLFYEKIIFQFQDVERVSIVGDSTVATVYIADGDIDRGRWNGDFSLMTVSCGDELPADRCGCWSSEWWMVK